MSPKKRKRGRPPGGTSLVDVRFGDLKEHFADDVVIPVGRVFLEKVGLLNKLSNPEITEREKSKPDIQIIKFD